MNKGKKLRFCKQCNQKRFCSFRYLLPAREYIEWICSKNHKWTEKIGPLTQIIATEIDRILSNIKNIFERDDIFYSKLKR